MKKTPTQICLQNNKRLSRAAPPSKHWAHSTSRVPKHLLLLLPHNSMEVSRALPCPSSVMACPSVPLCTACCTTTIEPERTPVVKPTTICAQGVPTHSAGAPLYEPLPVQLYTFYIVHKILPVYFTNLHFSLVFIFSVRNTIQYRWQCRLYCAVSEYILFPKSEHHLHSFPS